MKKHMENDEKWTHTKKNVMRFQTNPDSPCLPKNLSL